ncbi:MAG: thiol-disulfide oxidoreductase DCC [Planctomycetota bacterium]|nr:MAG: thiol-disulfide oxidoreductase DCC [Planctomycetota bacterium]
MSEAPEVLLFDKDCRLCTGLVRWILDRDRSARIHFAARESAAATKLLAEHGASLAQLPDSLVLINGTGVHTRSEAVLRVAALLGKPWSWAGVARILPRPLRDLLYRGVARYRYGVFGRSVRGFQVPPHLRNRFLDQSSD